MPQQAPDALTHATAAGRFSWPAPAFAAPIGPDDEARAEDAQLHDVLEGSAARAHEQIQLLWMTALGPKRPSRTTDLKAAGERLLGRRLRQPSCGNGGRLLAMGSDIETSAGYKAHYCGRQADGSSG